MTNQQERVTQLLNPAAAGKGSAAAELLTIVYDELHSLASALFRGQPPGSTLQPTALVHEAYLKLVNQTVDWADRRHFFIVASMAMRNILVDHARRKGRLRHGGAANRVPLDEAAETPVALDDSTVLAIDEALSTLAELDERKARLVELRFFGGLSADEAADALGIARSTAAEEWRIARAWLHNRLRDDFR